MEEALSIFDQGMVQNHIMVKYIFSSSSQQAVHIICAATTYERL